MQFKDVIGQRTHIAHLLHEVREERIPHARLFSGKAGCGALPMAVAYASYLLCTNKQSDDSCGICPACSMTRQLAHPDLHFAFPVVKNQLSDKYLDAWRELFAEVPYLDLPLWTAKLGADNQQPVIYTQESDNITQKLSLKASQGGYKIMVIWMAERMNEQGANRLLKLIEEPPEGTIFLLVCEEPGKILPTIVSRTQGIYFPPIAEGDLAQSLMIRYGLEPTEAYQKARLSGGSYLKAVQSLQINVEEREFFELFQKLMRDAFARKVKELHLWSEQLSSWGRERQKHFLGYCQRLVRENFMRNMREPRLLYMNATEEEFSRRFSPFIHEGNVMGLMEELDLAERDIEHNVNPRMVFFDLALKCIMLILRKPT
ncbi:MAG: DNA polymerase III subunit delta [Bacteroidales bacterium]|nr:DNA polymerase III subunit delta [Bacteroidales bacterium]